MNHRQPEQPNNVQFPAEPEPEYTLEEIMAEFGAPQEPEPIPEPVPEPEPIPEPEPVQPEPQQTSPPEPQPEPQQASPPEPQQERVHVFRPVPASSSTRSATRCAARKPSSPRTIPA